MAGYYDKLLVVCEKYLTTGAKDFLDRQIVSHLHKSTETVLPADKTELAKWCKISGGLLLGAEKAEKLSNDIISI